MQSKYVNGYKIYAFKNKNEILNFINNKKALLIAMNAEKILKNDIKLKRIVNKHIGYSDGIGAVLALKQKGLTAKKIAGSELWLNIISKYHKNKTFYLIGSTDEVIERTVIKLKKNYPNIKILGYRNGYLKDGDKDKLIKTLQYSKPDIIFVAQGSPKQEYLMDELFKIYPALYMGLGGSFDVYSGLKKRAPKIFLNAHLEWLYRLIKEPTRIKRQVKLIKFIIFLLFKKM
ncbi:UDP-N-acetyl-D-mannosaminouronate:lipid I N-acetyl-D-mannosaminouronosyltransferase [Nitratiruptor sp. YY08-26]|uniref:WecB/TagA/CpsF family glycosyltransferase n=1 Tax=unclassified Nitratiruptor TaxID=2624044 RepID=UPI0019162B9C|nr:MULTISPECIES: WecB/TagA/CpsF family glycosyltransferase [unclassified Nitratiruptor]BCD62079.1 UDP-N-acetyl-D-mannosaminouronate:lipid I N-acetyl-D-mannosaminouronosyltransferase [Nitratiruptor sp. YY08-13]BCD66015.1 UDP-N-acetyl-D-mannosaminouronate:lipid I N-acetyl-D-mannosaminouronosyltransferase [Nitratiruptor sp. YY08-26]